MAKRANSQRRREGQGNFIAEWFGHRVHPTVMAAAEALSDQSSQRCPFLSEATLKTVECIKSVKAKGVCTISSSSNGPRQDWLVCPHRALDFGLMQNAARRLFGVSGDLLVVPAPTLEADDVRERITSALDQGGRVVVFLRSRLGGEVSLSPTERSPEVSFDITMVEILRADEGLAVGRYSILEVQTMDFHGTYEHAVRNLTDALRLHRDDFHDALRRDEGRWLSQKIEGPNIANVFKRTFYQILLKFQIGAHESSAGCVLALPAAVWDSWQRHLGRPELIPRGDGTFELSKPGGLGSQVPAWIYVFDIDGSAAATPNPVVIKTIIATDADSIAHYAVKVAPSVAIAEGGAAGMVVTSIRQRLGEWWPALAGAVVTPRRRRRQNQPPNTAS